MSSTLSSRSARNAASGRPNRNTTLTSTSSPSRLAGTHRATTPSHSETGSSVDSEVEDPRETSNALISFPEPNDDVDEEEDPVITAEDNLADETATPPPGTQTQESGSSQKDVDATAPVAPPKTRSWFSATLQTLHQTGDDLFQALGTLKNEITGLSRSSQGVRQQLEKEKKATEDAMGRLERTLHPKAVRFAIEAADKAAETGRLLAVPIVEEIDDVTSEESSSEDASDEEMSDENATSDDDGDRVREPELRLEVVRRSSTPITYVPVTYTRSGKRPLPDDDVDEEDLDEVERAIEAQRPVKRLRLMPLPRANLMNQPGRGQLVVRKKARPLRREEGTLIEVGGEVVMIFPSRRKNE